MMWISFCRSRTPGGFRRDGTVYWLFQSVLGFQRLPIQNLGSCNRNIATAPGGPWSDNTSRSVPLSVRSTHQARWVSGIGHQSTAILADRCQLGTWMGNTQLAYHFPERGSRTKLFLSEVSESLGGACCQHLSIAICRVPGHFYFDSLPVRFADWKSWTPRNFCISGHPVYG